MKCRVCFFEFTPTIIKTFERMYGTREAFDYSQCPQCDCLQIVDVPSDLSRFYPTHSYYSFEPKSGIKQMVRRAVVYADSPYSRVKWNLAKYIIGTLWRRFRGPSPVMHWIKSAGISQDMSILDLGCGAGVFVYDLQDEAFPVVDGIEPFISKDVRISSKSLIRKGELRQCGRQYDFVMMNHSLEHIADQHLTMRELNRVVSDQGVLLLRIPIINSANWREYGLDWVNLDAPRHLYLHSEKSLKILAEEHGFEWFKTEYDGNDFGIWASKHYQNGHSLYDVSGTHLVQANEVFSKMELTRFKQEAEAQNAARSGDQACFYFRKSRTI